MNLTDRNRLWQQLIAADLVHGPLPTPAANTPWFTRVMLGIAAWIGALFLLGFIVFTFMVLFRNEAAALVVGIGLTGAGVGVDRAVSKNIFVEQLALAMAIAGQLLFLFGAAETFHFDEPGMLALLTVMQLLLFFAMVNPLHRTMSALVATFCFCSLLGQFKLFQLGNTLVMIATTLLWLYEFRLLPYRRLLRPALYGLTLAVMLFNGALLSPYVGREFDIHFSWWQSYPTLFPVTLALRELLFALLVVILLRRESIGINERACAFVVFGSVLALAAGLKAPGLLAGLILLLLGRANGHRILLGLGVFSLISYLGQYYYSLHLSLLFKSGILAGLGLLLLTGYFLLNWTTSRGGANA